MDMNRNRLAHLGREILALLLMLVPLQGGCAARPSSLELKDLIVEHFERQGYRVIRIDFGDIEKIPIQKMTYMGTKGYAVDVRLLVLEASADAGPPKFSKKGQHLTLRDGKITVRENPGGRKRWTITYISSNLAP
jgi:hypothetical protein